MQHWLLEHAFAGQKDIIIAYSSLTIVYDPVLIKRQYRAPASVFEWVQQKLVQAFNESVSQPVNQSAVIRIPVCYAEKFGPDLLAMAANKKMSVWDIINLHTARVYRVYTIGFLPGFSYMASVDNKLITPRKPQPETVAAGSVGIAGAQTGIYPLDSPGGWHIIGRTPQKQFDATTKELVKLRVGDRVEFYAISEEEFDRET